ncbi:MAG TPA: OFA family MFS transporter [Vicinamibacterales bacterium]|nr:OFA family MFS transporter [Vicinamibacterales bacterium]
MTGRYLAPDFVRAPQGSLLESAAGTPAVFTSTIRMAPMAQQTETATYPRRNVLIGASLFNIAIGSYYAWSVFMPALEAEFGWTRTQTSLVSTVNMVLLATMYNVAGTIIARVGSRNIAIIGGLCFSSGFLLASFAHSLTAMYLSAGLLVGLGLGFGYLPPLAVGFKWYPEARGLVSGLAVGVFAAGSGIVGPVAGGFLPLGWEGLVPKLGWRATFQILAGCYFLLTMAGAYFLTDPPADFVAPGSKARSASAPKVSSVNLTTSQMLKVPTFYPLWLAYMLGCIAGTMAVSQAVPFARSVGYSASGAAIAVTVGAAGSALGRFFSGWMSDHLGRLLTVRVILVISMIAAPLMYAYSTIGVVFYVLLFLVFYAYGTQLSVYTALAGDFYGPKHSAANYGILLLAWGTAGVFGPLIGGQVYGATGSYQYAFYIASAAAVGSLLLLMLAKPPAEAAARAHN